MHCCKWICGGVVGGVIGGAVWVAIELLMQQEFGWIAWIVGLFVGLGVHVATSADQRGGFLRGAFAALLALGAIIGAKVSLAQIMTYQAEKAAQPVALVQNGSGTAPSTTPDGATGKTSIESQIIPEELERDVLRESFDSTKDSLFKDMDMLWLCLGAVTAYIIGKGAGSDGLSPDESAGSSEAGGSSETGGSSAASTNQEE